MVSYRHWSVLLWWDLNDVPHRRILPSHEAERWSVLASLCWWCCYCLADQLWVLIAYARRSPCTCSFGWCMVDLRATWNGDHCFLVYPCGLGRTSACVPMNIRLFFSFLLFYWIVMFLLWRGAQTCNKTAMCLVCSVDMVHIGGTRLDYDTDLKPRPADTERILQQAYRVMPALKVWLQCLNDGAEWAP